MPALEPVLELAAALLVVGVLVVVPVVVGVVVVEVVAVLCVVVLCVVVEVLVAGVVVVVVVGVEVVVVDVASRSFDNAGSLPVTRLTVISTHMTANRATEPLITRRRIRRTRASRACLIFVASVEVMADRMRPLRSIRVREA